MLIKVNGTTGDDIIAPAYHRQDLALMQMDRYLRASAAHSIWAEPAKRCVDMVEGRQWTAAQLAQAEQMGMILLKWNEISPLVRLVLGYHRNNRTDTKFLPGNDAVATDVIAQTLTKLAKSTSEANQLPYVDTEVMLDGIITGRGFYDYRLDFEQNDFGELTITADDPFSVLLDPEGESYDLNRTCSFIDTQRWVSIEEVEHNYGQAAVQMLYPIIGYQGYRGGIPHALMDLQEEVTPWRTFGGSKGYGINSYQPMESFVYNCWDPARKSIRLIDCQWYQRVQRRYILDLETGDREPIPDHFDNAMIKKSLDFAALKYGRMGQTSPLRAVIRPGRRMRWTTMCGDIVVYDGWSPYETFTKVPYFPWFRRGATRGMVEDLIDPQEEINWSGSSMVDIMKRTAHSGWQAHEKSLSPEEQEKLEMFGGSPGYTQIWRGEAWMKPDKIDPSPPPTAMARLEERNSEKLRRISGINEAALGELDQVQSGVALEARQKQAVLSIQVYMDNNSRTKELGGRKELEIYQNHYRAPRIRRMTGPDGQREMLMINQVDIVTGEILNNLNLGKYSVAIDETPLSKSSQAAQFEELIKMVETGLLAPAIAQDVAIEVSSVPQKEMLKQRTRMQMAVAGIITPDQMQARGGVVPPGMAPPPGPAQTAPAGAPQGQAQQPQAALQ